jgi:hypothetical protein
MAAETPLMIAICDRNVVEALEIVASGQGDLGAIRNGKTALFMACWRYIRRTPVALAIIATGQGHPGHINDGTSVLMCASRWSDVSVVNALLATGESNPGFVGANGNTALTLACCNCQIYNALALIATGESCPEAVNEYGWSAITYARETCTEYPAMAEVIAALEALGL